MKLNNLFICLITLRLIETTVQFSQFTFNGTQYSCTKHSCIDSFYRAKGSDKWTYSFTGLKVAFKFLNQNQEGILRESGIIQSFEDACGADRICVRRCRDIDTVPSVSFKANILKAVENNVDTYAVENSAELEYYEFWKFIVELAIFLILLLFLIILFAVWLIKKLIGLVRWILVQIKKRRTVVELCDCECCERQRTLNISCDCTCDCGGDCLDDYKQQVKIGLYKTLLKIQS